MLINAVHPEERRVAMVADGILEELDVQIKTREATLGNIYKGAITRIEPSLQAAFVDFGAARNGFLPISDVHPSYFPESVEGGRRRPRIEDVFKREDHVIVQVNKEERDNKGASLTTNISLAGRYLVLMPGTDLHGVSRKIEDEKERKKLREIVKQLKLPDNVGFIIRTAGMGRTKTALSRDLTYVLKLWKSIEKDVADEPAPALLYREQDVVIRSIRDHFSPDISEILVDDRAVHKETRNFFHQVMPRHEKLVKLYQEKRPLFNKYQLEEQIEQVYRRRINLKSGGHIIIEPTEALVTVDVNSGSATREKGIEETAYRVNMEAAPEIARQLRLRDLGGIIVIDFIDMFNKNHKLDVERALKDVLRKDRAKTKVLRISTLGLLELSRQRLKSSLGTGEYLDCPLCDGRGKIRSPEMSALSIFRKIKSFAIKPDVSEVKAVLPGQVAQYLLNNMRASLVHVEEKYGAQVIVTAKDHLPENEIVVEAVKKEPADQIEAEGGRVQDSSSDQVAASEEEAKAESERKRPRKPRRRRPRGRRKPQSDAARATAAEVAAPADEDSGQEQLLPRSYESVPAGAEPEPEAPAETEEFREEDEKDQAVPRYSLKRLFPFF